MGEIMGSTGKTRLEVNLTPIPQAVGIARIFVRHQLISLRYADLVEDACVITSELMTNAVKATASDDPKTRGRIRLYLGPHDGGLYWRSGTPPPGCLPSGSRTSSPSPAGACTSSNHWPPVSAGTKTSDKAERPYGRCSLEGHLLGQVPADLIARPRRGMGA
jgi:hypothetical protein